MATINTHYNKLAAGYLFPEIDRRTREFAKQNPEARVMRLGVGNTTEPLPDPVIQGLIKGVSQLAHRTTYTGYGDERGILPLREALVQRYARYGVHLHPNDFFVSDGAKCDSGNIQSIFGQDNKVAVQDPSYPVYVDSNVMVGRTGAWTGSHYEGMYYMPCTEANHFFPNLPSSKVDILYLCYPNNPTGATASHAQLKQIVDYARSHRAVIIFDAAYASYITDSTVPHSIYEVEGAKECAIEINSFSKEAGFTGVRLGWTVVPEDLVVENTQKGEVQALWHRRQSTVFNGASNIVQQGGVAILSEEGQQACAQMIAYYMNNAKSIRQVFLDKGYTLYGGDNAPYIWIKLPEQQKSWEFFDTLLEKTHVVGTPGIGFGPSGEGFFRLSAFGHKESVEEAVESIRTHL